MTVRTTFASLLAQKLAPAPLTEGVESIQEVSDDTLNRYSKKAREQISAIKKKPGPTSKAGKAVIAKREVGTQKVTDKLNAKRSAEYDKNSRDSHAGFTAAVHKTLTDAGYALSHPGKKSNLYTKHDPHTNSMLIAKHHIGAPSVSDSHHNAEGELHMVTSNGTSSNVRHNGFSASFTKRHHPDTSFHDHHAATIKAELDRHERWHNESSFRQSMNESDETVAAGEPLTEAQLEEAVGYITEANMDELGAAEAADAEALETAEEAPEVVAEGRGRPRKDGTSAVGADREHIIMQLRKHVSLRGQNPIEFKDGSKASPGEGQARLALVMHNGLRTAQEKAHFMNRLDANHESFKDAVRSKTPEEAGKAPAAKSRITLPAIDRLNAKLGPDTH